MANFFAYVILCRNSLGILGLYYIVIKCLEWARIYFLKLFPTSQVGSPETVCGRKLAFPFL